VVVEVGSAVRAGDTLEVAVYYRGAPHDGLIFGRDPYGRPTVFADNWPDRARFWFPAIDRPGDKATVEFRVRTPADWSVVSVGRLVGEEMEDGRKLTVWATQVPIPVYTMVVGAGVLGSRELGALGCELGADRCVRVSQWTYPEDAERAARAFRRAPEIVAFFDSLIAPYPYEKLALVQSSTRFGGMENSSAIFLPERIGRWGRVDGLLAHEIVHQWFGDAVTEADWSHLWLSEGFATYFATVFFELRDGGSAAGHQRAESEREYMASAADVARPIVAPPPAEIMELLNANNYNKGAWVLHMLRRLVGDEAFFAAIRRYYAEHRDGTALSDDLRRVMEQAAGRELGWFFEQWLYRPGYPQLEVRHRWNAAAGTLELRVSQVQEWPPFRLPLEIEAAGPGYELRHVFWVDGRESEHAWTLAAAPERVSADPENAVLGTARVIEETNR
jgi:aminopeptidase N